MSFYTSTAGKIDGSAEASHIHAFSIIPDNTSAPATIKKVELVTFDDGGKTYQVTYKILDGDYRGFETRQKINAFETDEKKKARALNMLVRLFNLCNYKPSHSNAPTNEDLAPLTGNNIGIVVRQWFFDGKEGNYISEIHPLDAEFKTVTGTLTEAKPEKQAKGVESALTRHAHAAPFVDSDLPF